MFQIIQIQIQSFEHLFHGVRVAIVQCGIRGNTGTDLVKVNISWVTFDNLVNIEFSFCVDQ